MKKFVPILVIFLASSLIFLYFKGDYDSAMKLADQGNVNAQIELGKCFFEKCDYDNAIKWLKPFAEQGNVAAQNWLKQCLIHSKRK